MKKQGTSRARTHAGLFFPALAGVVLSLGFQGEPREIFSTKGRLVSEGRVFSIACHDFDRDGRLDIAVSDYLNPARILYGDDGLAFNKAVSLTSTAETATTGHGVALRTLTATAASICSWSTTNSPHGSCSATEREDSRTAAARSEGRVFPARRSMSPIPTGTEIRTSSSPITRNARGSTSMTEPAA